MIKKTYKPTEIAAILGLTDKYSLLDGYGVVVVVHDDKISVIHKPTGKQIVGNLNITPAAAQLLIIGKVGKEAAKVISPNIAGAMDWALNTDHWASDDMIQANEQDIEIEWLEIPEPASVEKPKPQKHSTVLKMKKPKVTEAMAMDTVLLKNATTLYQPVHGTSENSIYHCVGMTSDLKFAARRVNNDLSIRVEGPVQNYKNELISAGFNEEYIAKGYTSVHFNGIDDLLAQRTLAAVLGGSALEFETPLPHFDKINQKGV